MNNYSNVAPETRQKVKKVMDDLNYKPNHIARGLKTNKSYNIVFLIPDITNEFYTEIYKGIYAYALERGYIVSLYETSNKDSFYESILNTRPDGIILGTNLPSQVLIGFKKAGIPVTAIGGINNPDIKMKISINLYQAISDAVEFLYNLGHREIGMITYKNDKDERNCGYRNGIRRCDISLNKDYIIYIESGTNHFDQGYFAMKRFLKRKMILSAVIAHNDLVAIGAMKAIMEAGLNIPNDISVLGFDDTRTAKYTNPSLTSIKIPKFEQGQRVADLLLNHLISNEEKIVEMSTELIIRDSVKNTTASV